ncbi:MAG: FAD-dependent oxidoreductase, partial [Actinobacteria bacterium]|nr:FAD-dependent oxidoreductase [Actinomycetota bacterium]
MAEHESVWITTSEPSGFAALEEAVDVDVAVLGGGIAGLSAALLLKNGGLRVAVLEAGAVCCATTGHTTAKVSAQHGLTYDDAEVELWRGGTACPWRGEPRGPRPDRGAGDPACDRLRLGAPPRLCLQRGSLCGSHACTRIAAWQLATRVPTHRTAIQPGRQLSTPGGRPSRLGAQTARRAWKHRRAARLALARAGAPRALTA